MTLLIPHLIVPTAPPVAFYCDRFNLRSSSDFCLVYQAKQDRLNLGVHPCQGCYRRVEPEGNPTPWRQHMGGRQGWQDQDDVFEAETAPKKYVKGSGKTGRIYGQPGLCPSCGKPDNGKRYNGIIDCGCPGQDGKIAEHRRQAKIRMRAKREGRK
jgi:hypothetical protein